MKKTSNQTNPYLVNKSKTRQLTNKAIYNGEIIKESCKECGSPDVQCHHLDYTDPYKIMWLCAKHHREWHRNNPTLEGFDDKKIVWVDPATHQLLKIRAAEEGTTIKALIRKLLGVADNDV